METSNVISALAAALAAGALFHSFWLERRLRKDDRIIFDTLSRPGLRIREHAVPVLAVNLANLGRRKAAITSVLVNDTNNKPIDVTWSNVIDALGNTERPNGLFLVDEKEMTLFIRRNDGAAFPEGTTVQISHTHSSTPHVLVFSGLEGLEKFFG